VSTTLYQRLGGYDAVAAVADDLVGMRISASDWSVFRRHLEATLDAFRVPLPERDEVIAFVESTRGEIVEA
jgi:hypothetical protein